MTSLKLDTKGSSASAEVYWLEVMATANAGNTQGPGSPLSLLSMGRSEDELVKRDGKWLISKRIIIADMSRRAHSQWQRLRRSEKPCVTDVDHIDPS